MGCEDDLNVNVGGFGSLLNIITAVVLSTASALAAAIMNVSVAVITLGTLYFRNPETPRYSKECTYRTRHIISDGAILVSLTGSILAIVFASAARALAGVALGFSFVGSAMIWTDPGDCQKPWDGEIIQLAARL